MFDLFLKLLKEKYLINLVYVFVFLQCVLLIARYYFDVMMDLYILYLPIFLLVLGVVAYVLFLYWVLSNWKM